MSSLLRNFLAAFSVIACCRGLLSARGEDQIDDVQSRSNQHTATTHIYKEGMPLLSSRSDLVKRSDIHRDYAHELVFAVQQRNIDELERALHDVSDPTSPNYGQHWSGEEVGAMTSNPLARDATVAYLHANGVTITSETRYGEYITATAPISTWDKVLNTRFFKFHQRQINGVIKESIRAEAYSIPIELDGHVAYVLNTIEMPVKLTRKAEVYEVPPEFTTSKRSSKNNMRSSGYSYGFVLPVDLRRYYNFSTNHGSALSTQEAFTTGDDWLNPNDLAKFQSIDHTVLNQPAIAGPFGRISADPAALAPNGYYGEGNLDIEYLIGMSPGSPTTYGYYPWSIGSWMASMSDMLAPPRVLSISYGLDEIYNSYGEFNLFDNEAIKLSIRGSTIVVAAGDDGAVSPDARGGQLSKCDYRPLFPATSPYVVAVGATSGAENREEEVVCSAGDTGRITSGGGFSMYYSQPNFQTTAVKNYFIAAAAAGQTPVPGFNEGGRAYPDIATAGLNYLVIMYGGYSGMSGTSAAAPVTAAAISNINAARMAIGKGSLGWVNPALYANAASFTNDIVKGNNTCSATAPCCPHGFYATKGWDPTTGLGSFNYGKMQATFLALGDLKNSVSRSPTKLPTTKAPSFKPTSKPKKSKPTRKPTRRPTAKKVTDDSPSDSAAQTSKASTIRAIQTLTGVEISQTTDSDFINAVAGSVISVLGVPDASVTDITTTASGRRLLSGVTLAYTVSVADGMTPEQVIASLQTSVSSGEFLTTLSDNSGVSIDEVTNLQTVDLSRPMAPAAAPATADSSSSNVAAVASGCAGGLLLGIVASFLYFNRARADKKKKLPAIHTNVAGEDAEVSGSDGDRDLIPRVSIASSPRALLVPTISSPPPGYKPLPPANLHFGEVYPVSSSNA